jgi:hypothetical protein
MKARAMLYMCIGGVLMVIAFSGAILLTNKTIAMIWFVFGLFNAYLCYKNLRIYRDGENR